MKSIKQLYKIGPGPSSSHTLGPANACRLFLQQYPDATSYVAVLYGSLSLTGRGHRTDYIIKKTFSPKHCDVIFRTESLPKHPNGMELKALDVAQKEIASWRIYSVGGGSIEIDGIPNSDNADIYPERNLEEVKALCQKENMTFENYCDFYENEDEHLNLVFDTMIEVVDRGLKTEGVLPGKLKLARVAKKLFDRSLTVLSASEKERLQIMAYAYAASEENAAGGITVTSPTLGASGVIPALIYHYYKTLNVSKEKLIQSLKIACIFGNIIKENATISGAQGGCQAEIGSSCAMGSALVAYLHGYDDKKIEYAAEMGIEHHLGLTCDPVGGYVMIPCIERNAVAAIRCLDNVLLASNVGAIKENKISFDMVVNTMNYTGQKIAVELRETSLGGLALEIPISE